MKTHSIICLLFVVALLAVNTATAADSSIPAATLQAMGLEGMTPVDDATGNAIRAKGFTLYQSSFAFNRCSYASAGVYLQGDCCPKNLYAETRAAVWGGVSGGRMRTY